MHIRKLHSAMHYSFENAYKYYVTHIHAKQIAEHASIAMNKYF